MMKQEQSAPPSGEGGKGKETSDAAPFHPDRPYLRPGPRPSWMYCWPGTISPRKELSDLCHMDVTTMSRSPDRLEESGYLVRERIRAAAPI